MELTKFEKFLGSGFLTGYSPFAPGTVTSFAALLVYLFLPGFSESIIIIPAILIFTIIGLRVSELFAKKYGPDPKQCTIDEVVGTWISLLFIPKKIIFIIPAFVIWRIFDILKPYPVRQMEKLKKGWGIMMDDIVAGIITFAIMQLFIYLVN